MRCRSKACVCLGKRSVGFIKFLPVRGCSMSGVVEEIAFRNQRLHTTLDIRTGDAVREKSSALGELLSTDLVSPASQLPFKQLENQPLNVFGSRHRALRALSKKSSLPLGRGYNDTSPREVSGAGESLAGARLFSEGCPMPP